MRLRKNCLKGYKEHDDELFVLVSDKSKLLQFCLRCHSFIIVHSLNNEEKP